MKLLVALLTVGTGMAFGTLAYTDPATVGNQLFTGALGMDFNVNSPIIVRGLGAFDSSQNGVAQIRVQIFDRTTALAVAGLDITITGTMGTIISGDRVVTLGTPITLPTGFQGSVVASFFGNDLNGNSNPSGLSGGSYSTTNTGGGLISFVGTSRYGLTTGAYPTNPDGNVAKYGAGTFDFTSTVPEPGSMVLMGMGLVAAALYRRKQARS